MATSARRRSALCAAATLVLGCVSCNKSPTSPSPDLQSGLPSPRVAIIGLRLVAPEEIAPGESIQLIATAIKSDSSVENVTSRAQWTVQSVPAGSMVLTVTETGLATGVDRGRGLVSVRFAGYTADAAVLVLPHRTFRLAGIITLCGRGVKDVTVTVISGSGTGLTSNTDSMGQYGLYGVAGIVQIRASKAGYPDRIQQVDVTAHRSHSFELMTENPAGIGCWDY